MQTLYRNQQSDDLPSAIEMCEASSLRHIILKAKRLLAINQFLQTVLPATFAPYCQVMNISGSTLILGTANAAIATRIQLMSDELVRALKNKPEFSYIYAIRCKVNVDHTAATSSAVL